MVTRLAINFTTCPTGYGMYEIEFLLKSFFLFLCLYFACHFGSCAAIICIHHRKPHRKCNFHSLEAVKTKIITRQKINPPIFNNHMRCLGLVSKSPSQKEFFCYSTADLLSLLSSSEYVTFQPAG